MFQKQLMSACNIELNRVRYPLYGSRKYDGIRSANQPVIQLHTRTLLPVPNRLANANFGRPELLGMDGELISGPPNAPNTMQVTMSAVMTELSTDPIDFYVFDIVGMGSVPFEERYDNLQTRVKMLGLPNLLLVEQVLLSNEDELLRYDEEGIALGYEGSIFRTPLGFYKNGRCSMIGQQLMKLKKFTDAEAVIIGFEELQINTNEAVLDIRGLTKRSTKQENRIPAGMLGKFIVRDVLTGIEFPLSGKITKEQRIHYWNIRDQLLGQFVTYKHFKVTGVRTKPRQPIFKWFRDRRDFEIPSHAALQL